MMMTDAKLKKISIILLIFTIVFSNTAAFASPAVNGRFHIRQIRKADKGVLTSKPNNEDLSITSFLVRYNINSLEKYYKWLGQNLQYQQGDSDEVYLTPQDVLRKRKGDCDDFAFLNSAVVRVMGYSPRFIALIRNGRAHAICVFKKNGRYVMLDNSKFHETEATTLDEFGDFITNEYTYNKLVELDLNTKTWATVYEKG